MTLKYQNFIWKCPLTTAKAKSTKQRSKCWLGNERERAEIASVSSIISCLFNHHNQHLVLCGSLTDNVPSLFPSYKPTQAKSYNEKSRATYPAPWPMFKGTCPLKQQWTLLALFITHNQPQDWTSKNIYSCSIVLNHNFREKVWSENIQVMGIPAILTNWQPYDKSWKYSTRTTLTIKNQVNRSEMAEKGWGVGWDNDQCDISPDQVVLFTKNK